MGKRLVKNEGDLRKGMMYPNKNDVVLVSPWDFQSEEKGDIVFRYTATRPTGSEKTITST